MITPAQCRAARAMLKLPQKTVAERCGVNFWAYAGFENGKSQICAARKKQLVQWFSECGVTLIGDRGVMLKQEAAK